MSRPSQGLRGERLWQQGAGCDLGPWSQWCIDEPKVPTVLVMLVWPGIINGLSVLVACDGLQVDQFARTCKNEDHVDWTVGSIRPPSIFSRSAVHGCPARKSWNGTTNSNWTMMTTGSVHHAEMLCCWTSAVRHSCWKHRIDHQRCLTPRCMLDFLAGVSSWIAEVWMKTFGRCFLPHPCYNKEPIHLL